VRTAILRWQEEWRSQGRTRTFAARKAHGNELVGGCEIRLRDDGIAEMSYWTSAAHRGRGLAVRAVRLASDYAFSQLGVERIELYVEPDTSPHGPLRRRQASSRKELSAPEA
jgi:RimJ/RimL family protein N-acetyltransferase